MSVIGRQRQPKGAAHFALVSDMAGRRATRWLNRLRTMRTLAARIDFGLGAARRGHFDVDLPHQVVSPTFPTTAKVGRAGDH